MEQVSRPQALSRSKTLLNSPFQYKPLDKHGNGASGGGGHGTVVADASAVGRNAASLPPREGLGGGWGEDLNVELFPLGELPCIRVLHALLVTIQMVPEQVRPAMEPNLRSLSGVGMNQMELFEDQRRPGGAGNRDIPIRSGRVGTIRFGATETSFTVTRDALTDLASPPADESEETG